VIHGYGLGFASGPVHCGPSALLGLGVGLAFQGDGIGDLEVALMIWIGIAWLASLALVVELVYRAEAIEPDAEL
jgi:hypothetical protein